MSVEGQLSEYGDALDLMGVVTLLQIADIADEDRVRILELWCDGVGRTFEDWMAKVVVGPPVGAGGEESEVEVRGEVI